ncbi:MAG: hypothetical protein UV01_C0004G0060 [Parcubacteria group bacterium GW2011_GWA2_42_14]|nr:MAG: hypothetical protein UV01_C0004G0060 [Parcubacteria group bacterium GW2011_GWA2_42_14]
MKKYFIASLASFGIIGAFWLSANFNIVNISGLWNKTPSQGLAQKEEKTNEPEKPREKTKEELVAEALEKSNNIKGVYMTAAVATDNGAASKRLRQSLVDLVKTTELNGIVIDIKETDGVFLPESLKKFIEELHKDDIWVIARLVVFNDTVEAKANPKIALKRINGKLWLDRRGNGWLDPASQEAWDYIAGISKKAIDYGFDEIQYDYIRFPSDGDTKNIVYPVYKSKTTPKYVVLKSFFEYISKALKEYKPSIILSADLFGYVATQANDLGVGQRIEDIGNSFDYISFMLYPSHYYSGFQVPADSVRGLPAVYFPYRGKVVKDLASNRPYEVVHRSLLFAMDILSGRVATSSLAGVNAKKMATSTLIVRESEIKPLSKSRLRPWLQDFDLSADTSRGIKYDVEKVRAQIMASENAGASGWLLWNPSNVYTKEALQLK